MRSPVIWRVPDDALGSKPIAYDDLVRRAARYARGALAGRTLINHATQLAITLTPAALETATRWGAPTALLKAIPALPSLLSHALYVRSDADPQRRADVRRVHLLRTRAAVGDWRVELLFAVRETSGGHGFLDRVSARSTRLPHRGTGGGTPDNAGAGATGTAGSGDTAPASPDPDNSFYDSAAHRWGTSGAAIGAVAGGALALAGSGAVDAATGGLNLLATPAEIAGGAYAGSAIGGGLGWAAGSLKDAYDTLVNSTGNASRPPPGSLPIEDTPWSGDHGEIEDAIRAKPKDDVRISPSGDVWAQNPDGSRTNHGSAGSFTGSGRPSGRRGKDRDQW